MGFKEVWYGIFDFVISDNFSWNTKKYIERKLKRTHFSYFSIPMQNCPCQNHMNIQIKIKVLELLCKKRQKKLIRVFFPIPWQKNLI